MVKKFSTLVDFQFLLPPTLNVHKSSLGEKGDSNYPRLKKAEFNSALPRYLIYIPVIKNKNKSYDYTFEISQ